MSCKLEPAIWSRDTGQRIPCFVRCQLIIAWMSNIKEVHTKPRLHASVNPFLECGRHVPFVSHMSMGLRFATLRASGAPLLPQVG